MTSKYNLVVQQGATFETTITWTLSDEPVDLTGYTAAMQARESYKSASAALDLTSVDDVYTDRESLYLGGTDGTIRIYIDQNTSSQLSAKTYVYDLEIYTGTETYRLIEGTLTVTPEVTHA